MRWILLLTMSCWLWPPTPQPSVRAYIYVFLNTECPVSQQYTPRLAELAREFEPQGVRFVAYYPSPTDVPNTIRVFHQTYRLPFRGLPDARHAQVRRYGALTTPEVFVLNTARQVVYRGAIDDRYVSLGRRRANPTQHYLRDALDATLTNRPLLVARTDAVGCLIE